MLRGLITMSNELRVELPARLSVLHSLAKMVEDFGDAHKLPPAKVFTVNLELDELISNTVIHGTFEDGVDPKIDVHLKVECGILILTVEDNGAMFDPTKDTEAQISTPLETRQVGGLGLHLVKELSDRVSYDFVDGKNRLTLEHDLKLA